ncbi:MAG: helix-turn-helix transcriptional regulator [Ruminococcaceae bacterium]|nr:helix-turn-helix transcriptional regulator [Oscillospiraceae bacterium]
MEWAEIGRRIRTQREFLGYTREALAEKLDITPKFCSDIELGVKGMSVPTLCRISDVLMISVDYILFGDVYTDEIDSPIISMIQKCPPEKLHILEDLVKLFIQAIENEKH